MMALQFPVIALRQARAVLAVTALLALVACGSDSNMSRMSDPVSPISVGEPGEISAMALADAMLRVGFTREEILEMGPGIRRSLNQNGGAQALRDGLIMALFSHREGMLYVTSATSGTFVVRAT